jgi:hypothetical protein
MPVDLLFSVCDFCVWWRAHGSCCAATILLEYFSQFLYFIVKTLSCRGLWSDWLWVERIPLFVRLQFWTGVVGHLSEMTFITCKHYRHFKHYIYQSLHFCSCDHLAVTIICVHWTTASNAVLKNMFFWLKSRAMGNFSNTVRQYSLQKIKLQAVFG